MKGFRPEGWTFCKICDRHILDIDCDKIYNDDEGNAICEQCKLEEEEGAS